MLHKTLTQNNLVQLNVFAEQSKPVPQVVLALYPAQLQQCFSNTADEIYYKLCEMVGKRTDNIRTNSLPCIIYI